MITNSLDQLTKGITVNESGEISFKNLANTLSLPNESGTLATQGYVNGQDLGVGQTWQDVTASRVANTAYYNNSGKPIQVALSTTATTNLNSVQVSADGVSWLSLGMSSAATGLSHYLIVPNGWYYKAAAVYAGTKWMELR